MRWLLALFLLAGCDRVPTKTYWESKPGQPSGSITLTWQEVRPEEISGYCNGMEVLACALRTGGFCRIYFVPPKDFNDLEGLSVLGHESWHCLGATHER